MDAYSLLRQAILRRQQVIAEYQRFPREFCPHALGRDDKGRQMVMAFQFGGSGSKGLAAGGEWRCFEVAKLQAVSVVDGEWHTSRDHSRANRCVTRVDVEVS